MRGGSRSGNDAHAATIMAKPTSAVRVRNLIGARAGIEPQCSCTDALPLSS
jgi:hypothetical protein